MRIAMLSWESLHSISVGGVAAHVTELAAALTRAGQEVHVFTRRGANQRAYEVIDGVRYHRLFYPRHGDFVDDVNNMCRAFVERFFDVEDLLGHFDIVHAHDWLAANAMIWIKQGRGHRGVLTMHSTENDRSGPGGGGARGNRIREQERAGLYWADRVIAVSRTTRDELVTLYKAPDSKMSVVYNGVSPGRFDVAIDPGQAKRRYAVGPVDPTVLFCGRLTWQKGPDLLMESVPDILRAQPGAKILFAGDGEMRGALEGRARQLGVSPAVRFLGFRTGDELIGLFKLAQVVCVPSRSEPFGIVVLEAWSAGVPVVVSQNGGPSEYVTHEYDGLKIYPRPDSVAWGVKTVFANFERARWMGANGRQTVDKGFTWDRIARQTLGIYDPAAARRAVPRHLEIAAAPPVSEPVAVAGGESLDEAEAMAPVAAKITFKLGKPGLPELKFACKRVLCEAGFVPQAEGGALTIRGEWKRVVDALGRCFRAVAEGESGRLCVTLRPHVPANLALEAGGNGESFRAAAGL